MSEQTRQGICWICKLRGTLVMRRSWVGTKHWICQGSCQEQNQRASQQRDK